MKKLWILLPMLLLMTGCAARETFETLADQYAAEAVSTFYTLQLQLPEEASQAVMEASDGGRLYQCDGYTVCVQELDGCDLDKTFRQVTGYGKDALTVIQTRQGDFKRYSCAWTAAGEGVQQICRTVILDDGHAHHAVTVMADYTLAGQLDAQWQHILNTATLVSIG